MSLDTMVYRGTPPLSSSSLFSFKLKPKPGTSQPEFTHTLSFDSPQLLSGLFSSFEGIEYAIATCETKTVITSPVRSSNVALIEWKEGWVNTEGMKISLDEWGRSRWRTPGAHVFKKWGSNPAIKWEAKDGNWKATDAAKRLLAIFVVRRGTLTSRIELTDTGKPYADALVLTGLLSVTNKDEWKWHNLIQSQREVIEDGIGYDDLPTYREAPFTRPLSSLPDDLPPSFELEPPMDRVLKLRLASQHPLSGTWYEGTRPVVRVQTTGARTTLSRFIHTCHIEPSVEVVGTIDWGEGKVTVFGADTTLEKVLGEKDKSSIFSGTSRKSRACTLPNLTSNWTTTPHFSSPSVPLDHNAHIEYECRAAFQDQPLAVFNHYLNRQDTTLELTPGGHDALVEVLIGALTLIYGNMGQWK